MMQTFQLRFPEVAYRRDSMFAIELLDAVTLERVAAGMQVTAEGLQGRPIVNSGSLFVWRKEPLDLLVRITIDPGPRPYERVERLRADLALPPTFPPLTRIELPPRSDYPFSPGVTGMRATLLEDRGTPRTPVTDAALRLRWLDVDGNWRDAPTVSHTDARGDFAAILRLAASDIPAVDAANNLTVRLQATRGGAVRQSADVSLPAGRVADASTLNALTFAWIEMQT